MNMRSFSIMSKAMSKLTALAASLCILTPAYGAASDPVRVARTDGWSDQSYYIEMPDGVRLAASVWFPGGKIPAAKVPVVPIQTRYGRAGVFNFGENGQYRRLLQAGFAVVVVDTRGSTSSFGSRAVEIGPAEVKDMDTLIKHFRAQPWANGKVFATGVSYMADTADIATA